MDTIFMNYKYSKQLILIDYYSTFQIKYTEGEVINRFLYQILAYTIYGKI